MFNFKFRIMKKILFLLACSIVALSSFAQEEVPGIYYINEKLSYSRIIGKNVSNIAGAYFTLGLSSAKSNKIIEGENAETEIKEKKPEFTIIFGEDKQTGYIFSNARNIDNILLIQLHEKKGKRNLRTGEYGLAGVKTGIDEKDVIPLSIEKVENNKIKVHPKSNLKKGEYCFYYFGEAPSEEGTFNGVFDFSIK